MDKKTGIIVYAREAAAAQQWYIGKYIREFEKRGVSLRLVYTDGVQIRSDGQEGLYRDGSGIQADFAIVRIMAPRLSAALEGSGIRCFNSARVSEICNDKLKTYEFVRNLSDIPFMEYERVSNKDPEKAGIFPGVLKPRCSHGGAGIRYVENRTELGDALLSSEVDGAGTGSPVPEGGGYILQKPSSDPGADVRVYVLGGRIAAAMKRTNPMYGRSDVPPAVRLLSNYCRGGKAEVYDIGADETMQLYTCRICEALRPDFAGIDFIFDSGKCVFNEIEDVVGARMLYHKTDIDIVSRYVDHIVRNC